MLKVTKAFKYAYNGIDVKEFAMGDKIADDDPAAAVALAEKWATRIKGKQKPSGESDGAGSGDESPAADDGAAPNEAPPA